MPLYGLSFNRLIFSFTKLIFDKENVAHEIQTHLSSISYVSAGV